MSTCDGDERQLTSLEVLTPESPRWDEFADRLFWIITDGNVRCDCDREPNVHRYAKQIMSEMGSVDIPASIEFFQEHGGYCDCEILLNVDPDGRIWSGTAKRTGTRQSSDDRPSTPDEIKKMRDSVRFVLECGQDEAVVGVVRELIDANHLNRAIEVVEAIVACYRSEEAFANGLHVMTKGTPWTQEERADIKAAVLKQRGRDRGDAPLN